MDIETLGKMIGNQKRIRILQIICEYSMTASECYKIFRKNYDQNIRRESVYRELECLREGGVLEKRYSEEQKKLCYSMAVKKLTLDLCEMNIQVVD